MFALNTSLDEDRVDLQYISIVRLRPTPDINSPTQKIVNSPLLNPLHRVVADSADDPLFAYDYEEMAASMVPFKEELLRVVLHPRNLTRLSGLGLVN